MYNLFFFVLATMCLGFNIMSAKIISLEQLNLSTEEIDDIVNEALEKFNIPGASISLVFNGDTLLSKGYGYRDLDKKLPVTERTLFSIASCTKAFTALALAQLVDEGKVAFDDPVQKYIPEFYLVDQERTTKVTIRDLLAHRTGVPRHDPIWFYFEISRESVIGLLKNLEPACDLRQNFQYNNFMYTVAGIIVERVTGQSWEEFISLRLFKPLEMNDSITSLKELEDSLDFSLPYAEINGMITQIPFHNTFPTNPGGGIISNALDMSNWLKLQLEQGKFANNNLIQRQTFKDTHTIHMSFSSLPNEKEKTYHIGYGLGWFVGKYEDYDFIWHGGNIDGFSSEVALLPEKKLGLVVLTNSGTDGQYFASTIRNQIFDKILGTEDTDWITKTQEVRKQSKDALNEARKSFNENCLIPSDISLESFVGFYQHPAYGKVEVRIENNDLIASYGKVTAPLKFKSENVFSCEFFPDLLFFGINPIMDFKFFKNSSGIVYKVEIPFEGFRSSKPITFIKN